MTASNCSSSARRALLVSPVGLDSNSAGSIFLRSLLGTAAAVKFSVVQCPQNWLHVYNPTAGTLVKIARSLLARLGSVQVVAYACYAQFGVRKDARRLTRQLSDTTDGLVVMTLSSPESIKLAHQLATMGCALNLLILDDPEYLLGSLRFGARASKNVMGLFGQVLQSARAVAVVSDAMRDRYTHSYGVSPIVIRPGTVVPATLPVHPKTHTFRLAFAGSLYAKQEWNSLIQALDQCGWVVKGKRVVVYFVGAFPKFGARSGRHVVKLGYRAPDVTREILSKCHAAYLPYWLSPDKALVASTSFPSKLATYLSCGLPVLHHGPVYTEAAKLLAGTHAGVCCDQLGTEAVLDALADVFSLAASADSAIDIKNVLVSYLSEAVMEERFAEFIHE